MPVPQTAAGQTPRELFFRTTEQRIALARQKFFEEGVRPTGVVGEAVIQSWMRCLAARQQPERRPEFQPVTASRAHSALARSRELLAAADDDLGILETALAGTDCRVILTDGEGVTVHVTQRPAPDDQPVLRGAARLGVDLAETLVGTTAPGVVARTGHAVTVVAGEHFHVALARVDCAAAPIRDARGRLAGVLDLSVEGRGFGFHAASMVGLYATRIENRLLQMQSLDLLIVRFQADPHLLHTPLEALAGIDARGELRWLNAAGARLLAVEPDCAGPAETLFGLRLSDLLALTRLRGPAVAQLPSGLRVWLQARLRAGDGADFNRSRALAVAAPAPAASAHAAQATSAASATSAAPPTSAASATSAVPPTIAAPATSAAPATPAPPARPGTLGDHGRQLIDATLAECGGNISRAARQLGVSRGLLYRRLRSAA